MKFTLFQDGSVDAIDVKAGGAHLESLALKPWLRHSSCFLHS